MMLTLFDCLLESRKKTKGTSRKLVNTENIVVVIPSEGGSTRLYCAGTKWCIASKQPKSDSDWLTSFEDFKEANLQIAIIISKRLDSRTDRFAKMALVKDLDEPVPAFECYDALNSEISWDDVQNAIYRAEPDQAYEIIKNLISWYYE